MRSDCGAWGDAISVEEAHRRLAALARPLVGSERVHLASALGRILAAPLVSPRDVPAFDNVAVDGYAFRASSLVPGQATRLRLVEGRAAAGHPFAGEVPEGAAVRVLTGAPLPLGTDTVALQEEVTVEGFALLVPPGYRAGANVRLRGEDVARDQLLFRPGVRLLPQHVGVAAELGLGELTVYARLKVGLFSSGDELREPGTPLAPGAIYDANRHMLRAFLAALPVEVRDFGILPDDGEEVRRRLDAARAEVDVLLTSGGASQGDEDHLARLVAEEGELAFWRLRMKPGRPLALGHWRELPFVALPGNPVAAAVCFLLFARPLLLAFAGGRFAPPEGVLLPAAFALRKKVGRSEFLRARRIRDAAEAQPRVERIAREGSGILTSMTEADGLVWLPEELAQVAPGDPVRFLSFAELGCH